MGKKSQRKIKAVTMRKLCLLLVLCGCGYTISTVKNIESLQLVPFENRVKITTHSQNYSQTQVYPVGLEDKITKFLKKEILTKTNLKLVQDSQVLLKGYIKDFKRYPLTYTESEDVDQYRIICVCRITLTDKDKVILDKNVTEDFVFCVRGENSISFKEAETIIAERIAEKITEVLRYTW